MDTLERALVLGQAGAEEKAVDILQSLSPVQTVEAIGCSSLLPPLESWYPEAQGHVLGLWQADGRDKDATWPGGRAFRLPAALEARNLHQLAFQMKLRAHGETTRTAQLVVAAMEEMICNAQEHSAADSAVAAWHVGDAGWEFGVFDNGRGVLESLTQNPLHSGVQTAHDALQLALQDGITGRPQGGGGYGFRDLFRCLVGRQASVRVRSLSASARGEGRSSSSGTLRISIVPCQKGFFVYARSATAREG